MKTMRSSKDKNLDKFFDVSDKSESTKRQTIGQNRLSENAHLLGNNVSNIFTKSANLGGISNLLPGQELMGELHSQSIQQRQQSLNKNLYQHQRSSSNDSPSQQEQSGINITKSYLFQCLK